MPEVKILRGDNYDHIQNLRDENRMFDLVLTDPPYNIGKDFGNDSDRQPDEAFLEELDRRISLLAPMLSRNAGVLLFCTHRRVGDVQHLLRRHFVQRRMMIWYYENGMSRQQHEPVTEYEPFWWFSKSNRFVYNRDDVRVPYKTERVKSPVFKQNKEGQRKAWTPNPQGRKRGDVWRYPTLAGKRFSHEKTEHPTQKPMSLFMDLIRAFCPKNADGYYEGRIIDPYLGSGTTAVCVERLNREERHRIECVGIEMETRWAEVAQERLDRERQRKIKRDLFE